MMLVLTIFLARAFGAEKFGVYALALSVGGLFEIIFNFGLGTVFLQRVSGRPENLRDELKTFLPLRVLLSATSMLMFVVFAAILQKPPETFFTLILASFYFSLFSIEAFLWCCFDSRQKMHFTAATKLLKFLIIFGLGLYLTFLQSPVHYLMFAYIAGVSVSIISTLLLISRYFTRIGWRVDFTKWKTILAEGWPIALSGAFIFIYNSLDTIIISVIKGEQAVGYYQMSYKIIGTLFLLSALINQAYFPSLVESAAKNKHALPNIFGKSIKSALFWSVPITFGGMLLAERIILFIFGPEYAAGIPAFKILIINCVIFFLSSAMTSLLYAAKKQRSAMKIFFLGAIANTGFNIFMIPLFGIEGAAITTLLAETVVLGGIYFLARRIAAFTLLAAVWQPVACSAVMCVALSLFEIQSLIVTIGIGGLIYFGSYFLISRLARLKAARPSPAASSLAHTRHDKLPADHP